MNKFSLLDKSDLEYVTFPFVQNNQPLNNPDFPLAGMTLKKAGSMRFRWNEENPIREKMLSQIAGNKTIPVPVQLNHTHIVYDIQNAGDTKMKVGDGIITKNRLLMPVVTVADCVPIFLFDPVSMVFGIVHSGWKGTGIAGEAIGLAGEKYGSRAADFCVVIGPHIHDCCYIVDSDRAQFFRDGFGAECVRELEEGVKVDWNNGSGPLFRLSLEKANLSVLEKAGVKNENISVCQDCTSCNLMYGSNRRETKAAGRPDLFTVQAAFVKFQN